MNEAEDADGEDQDKGTEKQAGVQMQITCDEIKASHQEVRREYAARASDRKTDSIPMSTTITANETRWATLRPHRTRVFTRLDAKSQRPGGDKVTAEDIS
jgi:hypothetical protein